MQSRIDVTLCGVPDFEDGQFWPHRGTAVGATAEDATLQGSRTGGRVLRVPAP